MRFTVGIRTDQTAITESVCRAVQAVDPDLPVAKFTTLTTLIDRSMTADRFSMLLVRLDYGAHSSFRRHIRRNQADRIVVAVLEVDVALCVYAQAFWASE
jgi:hypothetical protein